MRDEDIAVLTHLLVPSTTVTRHGMKTTDLMVESAMKETIKALCHVLVESVAEVRCLRCLQNPLDVIKG